MRLLQSLAFFWGFRARLLGARDDFNRPVGPPSGCAGEIGSLRG